LAAAAQRAPVLALLDDLQWADGDSLALLDELLERAPPRVMLAITSRFDVQPNRATAWVTARSPRHELPVEPLLDADIAAIIEGAAKAAGGATPSIVRELVPGAAGLPALAEVAGRMAARGRPTTAPSEALALFVATSSDLARRMLAVASAYDD